MTHSIVTSKSKHLFQVEILLDAKTNGEALEKLTHLLNQAPVLDYKINQGIQLGHLIDQALEEHQKTLSAPPKTDPPTPGAKANDNRQIIELIQHFMENETLVRLSIIKGKGIKLSLPCRILHFDHESEQMTVYHVDEKKVYPIRLNEIDDFQVN